MGEKDVSRQRVRKAVERFRAAVELPAGGGWRVPDASLLRGPHWDELAYLSVFAEEEKARDAIRRFLRGAAYAAGARPASLFSLYQAMGRREIGGFTVPAMNIRGLTYDTARAAFRAALRLDAGAFVFEIARSEIGYTEQRPAEYAALVLAAAVREGFRGPVFLQGDHFQVDAERFGRDPEAELRSLRDLADEALAAGFRNIDIDSSTLVDLRKRSVAEQQRRNFEVAAVLTRHVRARQPAGVPVCLGAEIGEVGGKNSTPEELRAFMVGYVTALGSGATRVAGISKISVQTGTTHGGVPLPDGKIAKVQLDLATLAALSRIARSEYGLAGAVQHGASTLPEEAFGHFPEKGCAEIHLATGFQNLLLDSRHFPARLRAEIEEHLLEAHAKERKKGTTREQFLYKTRKRAFGPFKQRLWDLPQATRDRLAAELEARFAFLFERLRVHATSGIVREHAGEGLAELQEPLPALFAGKR